MRLKTVLKIAAVAIVALIVTAVAVVLSIDFDRYKPEIAAALRRETGRELAIAGKLELSLLPGPAVKVGGVSFANAAWGSRPAMATAEEIAAEIRLLPLVFERAVVVERLRLKGVSVLLETDRQGRGNWQFDRPGGEAAAPAVVPPGDGAAAPRFDFAVVELENVSLAYRDGVSGRGHAAVVKRLEARRGQGRLALDLDAAVNGSPLRLTGSIGTLAELMAPTVPWPLKLELAVGGARLGADGSIAEPLRGRGINVTLRGEGRDLAELGPIVGAGLPRSKPYRLATTVTGDATEAVALRATQLAVGESNLSGDLTVRLGGPRPKIEGKLLSSLLSLDDLGGATAEGAKSAPAAIQASAAPAPKAAPAAERRVFPDTPLPFDALAAVDANLTLNAGRLRAGGVELANVTAGLQLADRLLTARPVSLELSGGRLNGELGLNGRQAPAAVTVKLAVRQLDVGQLLRSLKSDPLVEGKADGDVDLKGAGRSVRAIMASLDGRTELLMNGGRINNRYFDLIAADLLTQAAPWAKKQDTANVNCFVSRFAVKGGLATSTGLLLDTANATIQGEGTVNLATEQLGLLLKPRPKEASLVSLAVPIHVRGTLAEPSISPDRTALATGVAGAVAGTAINPLGVLIPLVSGGSNDKNACVEALAQPAKAGAAPSPAPRTQQPAQQQPQQQREGGVDGFVRGLGRSLDRLFGQ